MTWRRRLRPAVQRAAYGAIAAAGAVHRVFTRNLDRASGPPARVLIVRLDLMGDVLFTLPLAEAIKRTYPAAWITFLCLPYTTPLARLSPAVDEVIPVDTNRIRTVRGLFSPQTWRTYWGILRRLRGQRFDLAISAYGRMGSLCAALAGAERTIGYSAEAYPFLLDDPLPGGRHHERMHEVEYIRRFASQVGAREMPDHPTLRIPAEAHRRAAALLAEHDIEPHHHLVVIHAGSANGSAKRWLPERWARVIESLRDRPEVRTVQVGAASDVAIVREVEMACAIPPVSLVGRTDLVELAALIARADVVASGDSGPLHLAVVLGRPLVALYGPTDPAIYGPYRSPAPIRLLRKDLPCSPCYTLAATAECPLGDPICMRLIETAEVTAGVRDLLPEKSRG